jgi:hypothetical protein
MPVTVLKQAIGTRGGFLRATRRMNPEINIWRGAMVKCDGDKAMIEVAARADRLFEDGDWHGAAEWHRILNAIECLQAKAPDDGEAVH